MLVLMLVSLYTSRVVLKILGVEDYGIYNVVGGIVVLFTFINNAMISSTQRYLNYEIGRKENSNAEKIFSISVNIHLLISFLILILSETLGLWFLNNTIQYPDSREFAVQVTYQFSILTTCVKIIRAPYNAAIIAYERMSFYAYLSIFEAVLQLSVVFLLEILACDRLIMYGFMLFLVSFIINICYYIFCSKNFSICTYKFISDRSLYKQLLSFSGWSLFGGIANMSATQGLNMLLNIFFGVTVNAAMGIANQVNSAVTNFVHSFQTAFNPQIVKSYAADNRHYFIRLILSTSKYSYLLLYVISLPIYICCPEVLGIWLTEVPDYAVSFCRLMLILALIDSLQGPLWMSVQATGRIRTYQLLISFLILMNLPISYVCLKLGYSPKSVLIVRCTVNIVTLFVRLWYIKRLFDFPIKEFLSDVLARILPVTIITYMISLIPLSSFSPSGKIAIIFAITIGLNLVLIWVIGLNKKERLFLLQKIQPYFIKK